MASVWNPSKAMRKDAHNCANTACVVREHGYEGLTRTGAHPRRRRGQHLLASTVVLIQVALPKIAVRAQRLQVLSRSHSTLRPSDHMVNVQF